MRFAPALHEGLVYFGSDDGAVYCLEQATGALRWQTRLAPDHRVPGNGRIISLFPVRTGVVVDDGVVYATAGLWPAQGVWAVALKAATGEEIWRRKQQDLAPQGYLLASDKELYVPHSRNAPRVLSRKDGRLLAQLEGQGGAFALLTPEGLVSGAGRKGDAIGLSTGKHEARLAQLDGLRMVRRGEVSILQSIDTLAALRRGEFVRLYGELMQQQKARDELQKALEAMPVSKRRERMDELRALKQDVAKTQKDMAACYLWKRPFAHPGALVSSSNLLFAGGTGEVIAVDPDTGNTVWSATVEGKVHALAIADGRLIASTDAGRVYVYGDKRSSEIAEYLDHATPEFAHKLSLQPTGFELLDARGTADLRTPELPSGKRWVVLARSREHAADLRHQFRLDGPGAIAASVVVARDEHLPFASGIFDGCLAPASAAIPAYQAEHMRVLRGGGNFRGLTEDGTRVSVSKSAAWVIRHGLPPHPREGTDASDTAFTQPTPMTAELSHGSWTHQYADAAHTGASRDAAEGPFTIQWWGRPGPKPMIDRHHRPMAPLADEGVLVIPADERIIAARAANGALLWERALPGSRRVGIVRNAGHMMIENRMVHALVGPECKRFDLFRGKPRTSLRVPGGEGDWGYLSAIDGLVLGTREAPEASVDTLSKKTIDLVYYDDRPAVAADAIFALREGETAWLRDAGAYLNTAICAHEGRVYFLESSGAEVGEGRVKLKDFFAADARLLAVEAATGTVVWQQKVEVPFAHSVSLCTADDIVLLAGSHNEGESLQYGMWAFDADSGAAQWNRSMTGMDVEGDEPSEVNMSHGGARAAPGRHRRRDLPAAFRV